MWEVISQIGAAAAPLGEVGVGAAAAGGVPVAAQDLAGLGRSAQDARRERVVLRQAALILRLPLQPPSRVLVQLLVRADPPLLPGPENPLELL
jgi:hypothetical protein